MERMCRWLVFEVASVLGDGVVGDRVVRARAVGACLERAGVTEVGV